MKLLDLRSCHRSRPSNEGGSCAQVGRPGIKAPGRAEALPRTAAITRSCGHKKSACNRYGALLRLDLSRRPNRIAEFAATGELYASQCPGIKCPRTIFHITVCCRRQRPPWLGHGGSDVGTGPAGGSRTVLGRPGSGRVVLHLARAVVPPPRLRAKWVSISAPLQPSTSDASRASPERTGVDRTLQNPAHPLLCSSGEELDPEALFSDAPWETSNLGMDR